MFLRYNIFFIVCFKSGEEADFTDNKVLWNNPNSTAIWHVAYSISFKLCRISFKDTEIYLQDLLSLVNLVDLLLQISFLLECPI